MSQLPDYPKPTRKVAQFVGHNLARVGVLRRQLALPNPLLHVTLCGEIAQYWVQLRSLARKSPISVSWPTVRPKQRRAIVPYLRFRDLPVRRTKHRPGSRYVLRADISRFYPSLYTHSIAWALHSKATAKADRTPKLLGNRLDRAIRNAQDCQTTGIPIGPDTSFVIAEAVLSAVDQELTRRLSPLNGFRHFDDYELYFPSAAEAENALGELQGALAESGLALNAEKTNIAELPQPLEEAWVSELRPESIRDSERAQRTDLIRFFSHAFDLAQAYKAAPVLNYAIAGTRSLTVKKTNWPLLQALLLESATGEAGTLPYVLEQFVLYQQREFEVDRDKLVEVLNSQIARHSRLGHGSEVAWAIWGALAFDVGLNSLSTRLVSEMEDSIVALLALDADERGLMPGADKAKWASMVTSDELYGPQWLLSYEAREQRWLPTAGGGDHVGKDPGFKALREAGVSFYDRDKAVAVVPGATASLAGIYD